MTSLLKIFSILVVAAGAFLVYGAKFIAEKSMANNHNTQSGVKDNTENNDIDDINGENLDNIISQKAVNIKTKGLLLLMAGCFLVLLAFK